MLQNVSCYKFLSFKLGRNDIGDGGGGGGGGKSYTIWGAGCFKTDAHTTLQKICLMQV